ncbi:MAG: hypothetical protein EOP10_34005 [Proteobacteria bacterium]|nr:MAG: hypothetical protein EOP10_34005 [Pseudomonadota bacterium]
MNFESALKLAAISIAEEKKDEFPEVLSQDFAIAYEYHLDLWSRMMDEVANSTSALILKPVLAGLSDRTFAAMLMAAKFNDKGIFTLLKSEWSEFALKEFSEIKGTADGNAVIAMLRETVYPTQLNAYEPEVLAAFDAMDEDYKAPLVAWLAVLRAKIAFNVSTTLTSKV